MPVELEEVALRQSWRHHATPVPTLAVPRERAVDPALEGLARRGRNMFDEDEAGLGYARSNLCEEVILVRHHLEQGLRHNVHGVVVAKPEVFPCPPHTYTLGWLDEYREIGQPHQLLG